MFEINSKMREATSVEHYGDDQVALPIDQCRH